MQRLNLVRAAEAMKGLRSHVKANPFEAVIAFSLLIQSMGYAMNATTRARKH